MISFILSSLKDWKIFFSRSRSWVVKGGWAITDQAFFSGANFLVNILLARWLPPKEYGAFAVALSIFYLLLGFHTALITEPLMVFGAGKYRSEFCKYFGIVMWGHWIVSVLISVGLGVVALIFFYINSPYMCQALSGLALMSPFLLFFWLVRRGCYTQFQPMCAAVGSIFNFFLVSIGVILLWRWNKLSLFNSFLLLGIAGGITSLMLINKLKPQIKGYIGNPGLFTVFNEHRKYGQWSILAFLLYWSSGQILISGLVPIFLGLAASAAIAAIWNLYRPLSLLFQSSASIFLPVFSNWLNTGMPLIEFRKRVINLVIIFIGIFLTYGILITCFSKLILNFLYCGKYDRYILLVPLWSIALSASISINLFNMALKALGLVRYSSIIWGMSTGITLTLGIPMILFFGINGALLCLTFSYILAAVVSFLLVYKQTARDV